MTPMIDVTFLIRIVFMVTAGARHRRRSSTRCTWQRSRDLVIFS